jgi:hypothetical protein
LCEHRIPPSQLNGMAFDRQGAALKVEPPRWRLLALARLLRPELDDELEFQRQRGALEEDQQHFLHDMSIIDAKSSALLTHVSIMLAVIALFLGQPHTALWRWVFTVELTVFSVVAVLLLRCVDILGPPLRPLPSSDPEEIRKLYRAEILRRRAIFQFTVRAVRYLTIGLIATVLAKAIG